jgi:hypothetical protein
MRAGLPLTTTAVARTAVRAFRIPLAEMMLFLTDNPGFYAHLLGTRFME